MGSILGRTSIHFYIPLSPSHLHRFRCMVFSPLVEDYAASLKELTFNSRPIIVNLTTIAKENTDLADGILAAISQRIYHCIPEHKLFALYLLDLICKTVGAPYNVLIGDDIFKLFSHVFLLVDGATRARLVKMYHLWRVFRVKGGTLPLFPLEEMDRIQDFLQQAGFHADAPLPVTAPSATLLVAAIDALLPAMERRAAGGDTVLQARCAALSELRQLLQSQALSTADLAGVQEKLAAMQRQEAAAVAALAESSPVASDSVPTTPVARSATVSVASTPAPAPAPVPRAAALFSDLVASGLVSVDQSLKPGSKPVYTLVVPKNKYLGTAAAPSANVLEQLLRDAAGGQSQYMQIKVKELVKVLKKVTNTGLQQLVSGGTLEALTIQVLYETKLSKCAQCGKRFTGDDAGAARKRVHLDWHFRINKRQSNTKINIQSRSWYLDDTEWTQFDESTLLEYAVAVTARPDNAGAQGTVRDHYVVVPANDSNMNNVCLVCREHVKATYNDTLGEWVWDGCTYAPGTKSGRKIVHVACLEETSRKRAAESDADASKRARNV